ncbi:Transcriptional regulator, TetR family [Alloactinosynnema sp. L-07]|uniref:TetR/AcrR family transcriptional regulator n=1 Tax=Alloactinosynnema sp. L-07 TaxID=1653480 RepID=UPI00065F03C0|nr:TetR/AcrR family transcriptional regulator [Alloactinosynnema sp. L-07]CRK62155.1 Transcriptional regulator, TetR family [Alloactinosynnema sp. L-07]
MTTATGRRDAIADAAIATLARDGMRGLTHRAVDKTAGLPEGSCSYYFRTRQALLEATVRRLATLDEDLVAPIAGLPAHLSVNDLADLLTGAVELAATDQRDRHLARYELSLEATRRPELRATLLEVGKRYRELATALLTAAGAANPDRQGPDLVAYLDGLMFDSIAGAGAREFDRAAVRRSFGEVLAAMISGSPD